MMKVAWEVATEHKGLQGAPVGEVRKGPSLEPSERAWPFPHLDLGLLAVRSQGVKYPVL